ncbi:DUF6600 domain-containing protein [Cupriavidus agavae]|uniref:Branched-chain amino acid ABC transporter substrate-binding protein n=1 Tax=Cupriavidus agavae TaxID=1001822 RepID=A0A4Q7RT39_9BURK|nr:DUF6600 domain-containing protein [Cupriavidus agavae]RZT36297.1 hypothetical protein EV147_3616 [Cupriavidus agavae]
MPSRHRFAFAPAALGLAAAFIEPAAHAQDYNPGAPAGYAQAQGDPADANVLGDPSALAADPPSRIATVTDMAGGLSFAPAGTDEWAALAPNRPLTTGDRLWVEPGGRAELHAGSSTVRLGGGSAAEILNLDDRTTQVKLTQGTLQLRVRALPPDQQVEVDTPNLAFVPREPGDYRIDVAPDGTTTLVTMRHGSAVLYGDTRSVELERGHRMRFAGTDLADAGAGSYPSPDSFDQWTAARDAREDASVSARYVPSGMTGYTALDDYGDWQQDAGYGAVWFPRAMPAGWAPYSDGHWAWVAPWGWTWIDDAPWGFAPSHYGRWAHFGNRWGWVPGPANVRPCYAPAVVGFIGGAGTTIRIGSGPGVAWYPLGPRDAYRPVYRASPGYVNRLNDITKHGGWRPGGPRDHDRGRWANRDIPGAISGMPSRYFVEGRPVPRGAGRHREEWRQLPVGEGRGAPPMAPVKTSLIGGARPQGLPPMARQGFERQAIAAHPPGRIGPDDLARRFAREGGTAGAGPAWRGPVPDRRGDGSGNGQRRGAQPVPGWQPDVRMSQAAPANHFAGQRPDALRGQPAEAQRQQQALQRQQFEQQRQLQEQQRQSADFRQQQQQAMQRQRDEQQRELQNQQRQGYEQQRRQQFEQQRMAQEQRRQIDDQRREAMNRQQFDQQRQQQERQQQDIQRQAQQRQQQFEQQRQFQDHQRQQMEQQRVQAAQRQQLEQARQFQEQQRQQFEQQRQHALQQQQMQRQAQEQQRQAQEQQRRFQEQQHQQQQQHQQMQRQAQEQQRQFQDQQRQQQDRQRQFQQQQEQQQRRMHDAGRQARNEDRR